MGEDKLVIKAMPYSRDIMEIFAIYGEGILGVDPAREEYAEISPEEVRSITEQRFGDSTHKVRSNLPPHPEMTNRAARRARAAHSKRSKRWL